MFTEALFVAFETWKQPVYFNRSVNKKNYTHTYINIHIHTGILLSHKQEWNPAVCENMGEPGGHYAKWNKPDTERKIVYDLTYM